ncbi:hypothetical protein CWI26_09920 [Streptococcus suis]|uniref:Uncharacterized protein n=1 Tax=Streptococcus suis TaxID=1307 RepID=A0A2I5KQY2_STRSU|nr:hypothetical protein CWI26_09920 [Streptococcus suis]
MNLKLRKRIETQTGLFSLRPRNWKGAAERMDCFFMSLEIRKRIETQTGHFFLRYRNVKSAMTGWTVFS